MISSSLDEWNSPEFRRGPRHPGDARDRSLRADWSASRKLLLHVLVHIPHILGPGFRLRTVLDLGARLPVRIGTPAHEDEPGRRSEEPARPDHDSDSTHARASFDSGCLRASPEGT